MMIRSYSELRHIQDFAERYDYLRLMGVVGRPTFGFERYINQRFYQSTQWKQTRDFVIARDRGCDLGVPGFEIHGKILIHHMNPMLPDDILGDDEAILDPQYLISTTIRTHNAIHYGDADQLPLLPPERRPGDTKLW